MGNIQLIEDGKLFSCENPLFRLLSYYIASSTLPKFVV